MSMAGTNVEQKELLKGFVKRVGAQPYNTDDVAVLFLDVVAFSSLERLRDMTTKVAELQSSVFSVLNPHYKWDETKTHNEIIVIPTGDGYAVAFHRMVDREEVMKRVSEIYYLLRYERKMEIRMGLSRGLHTCFIDLNDNLNLIGDGIIRAQRAMTLAAPHQIFCTGEFLAGTDSSFKESFNEFPGWWRVKSEKPFQLFNYEATYGGRNWKIGDDGTPDEKFSSRP
jgi:class 3 adenylate cyclase